jgi:(R)-2-hydroxyacyl-CoA dehydratese activating ATPase
MIVAGCDVGSLTAEAVLMEDGRILGSEIIRVRPKPELSAREVMDRVLARMGLDYADIACTVSTGYGRETISFANHNVSEISCHGLGAHWLVPSIRTVIDVGGQDCKAILVDEEGRLVDFVMNDKCAAGTGRSLELMSESLGVDVSELGPLGEGGRDPVQITNQCSIFAEMEISRYLCEERSFADIAAGINESMARRVKGLASRVGLRRDVGVTGGVSKNIGVVRNLEKLLGVRFVEFSEDPQIVGALGAALFAAERAGTSSTH